MVRITRYPLPGVVPLYPLGSLVRAGVLDENDCESLQALRRINPLLFNLLLKRAVRFEGQIFLDDVFSTKQHFEKERRSNLKCNQTAAT